MRINVLLCDCEAQILIFIYNARLYYNIILL